MNNPILKREMTVQSRGLSLPLMVAGVNLLLFIAAFAGVFGILSRMQMTAQSRYGAFLAVYLLVLFLEFALLLFVTPSLTAGSISMERSMETLDLLLTTPLKPSRIIGGKLLAAAWTIFVLLASCIPAMLLPLIYGGIAVHEILLMLLVFLVEAAVLLCIGVFASSLFRNTVRSAAAAYGITAALCIGLPVASLLLSPFSETGRNWSAYFLVLDPLLAPFTEAARQTGREALVRELFLRFSLEPDSAFLRFLTPLSLACQLTMSFVLLLCTVMNLTPAGSRKKYMKLRRPLVKSRKL